MVGERGKYNVYFQKEFQGASEKHRDVNVRCNKTVEIIIKNKFI